jgi:hypothetical protein
VTISSTISTVYQIIAAGYQGLLNWYPAIANDHAARRLALAGTPWRHRHQLSSSEYPIAPILPRYQY